MAINWHPPSTHNGSLLALLHPRGQARLFAGALVAGLLVSWLSMSRLSVPLWGAVAFAMGLLSYPAVRKWRLDRQRLGRPTMVLSILLATQSLHTVEHIAQWVQYHLLG